MTLDLVLAIVLGLWWLAALIVHVGAAALALKQPAMRARLAMNEGRPPVSILIPVKRVEHEMEAALAAAFRQDYPGFEIIIAAARADAPALPVAERVRAQFPEVPARVIVSEAQAAASPKVNNLARALAEAAHDHVLILDSNIRLAPDTLARFMAELAPGKGLAVAVQIAVEPEGFAAELECAFINGYHGRLFLAASALEGGFGIGKAMLFRRSDFARAGGIPAIARSVLEDHAISKALARVGLKTAIVGTVVPQHLGRRRWREVWNRQFRWMVCRRFEEPRAFVLEPFLAAPAAILAGAGAAALAGFPAWIAAAGTALAWFATEAVFLARKGWGLRAASPAAWALRELIVPVMWLRAWTTSTVRWGELRLDVRSGTVLGEGAAGPTAAPRGTTVT
jgi:ceramide glucosyltransferase